MKINHIKFSHIAILLLCVILVACGGKRTTKSAPARPNSSAMPAISTAKPSNPTSSAPSSNSANIPAPTSQPADEATRPGGYYLDDGPEANPPQNLDNIPNAAPKKEALLTRSNKPYKALGATYTPMTSYQPYKAKGVASWYGKRFHGKKTSSGEVYDMYAMSAAHTTLPLPSYVKVTNPANGRSVIVRVNDRGPFKRDRLIDLSYAAAYKLRFISKGSTAVEIEAIDPDQFKYANQQTDSVQQSETSPVQTSSSTSNTLAKPSAVIEPVDTNAAAPEVVMPVATNPVVTNPVVTNPVATNPLTTNTEAAMLGAYVQAGAFKSEANAEALLKRIQALGISENVGINRVYNNSLHRVKLGPYNSRQEADSAAKEIRRELNISTIILNQ